MRHVLGRAVPRGPAQNRVLTVSGMARGVLKNPCPIQPGLKPAPRVRLCVIPRALVAAASLRGPVARAVGAVGAASGGEDRGT